MKKLKMNSGKMINVESIEVTGRTNDGFDLWYLDGDTGKVYHNLSFESDLQEAIELMNIVRKFERLCGEDFIQFTFSKKV